MNDFNLQVRASDFLLRSATEAKCVRRWRWLPWPKKTIYEEVLLYWKFGNTIITHPDNFNLLKRAVDCGMMDAEPRTVELFHAGKKFKYVAKVRQLFADVFDPAI